ncbi:MAG: serine/threonine protein kinase [Proteobacteria bacterium]|nr:serine/threonine protein kinase [Pseudomonadota bacterium]
MQEQEFFYRLTPDRVLAAVESAGFVPTGHCSALNALENRVYDVRVHGQRDRPDESRHLVAKFYRPGRWSREAILDEHRLLFALRAEEIPVCAPLVFADGDSLHEVEGIHYAIWPRTGGRAPDELDDDEVRVLGRLLARIHNVGEATGAPHRRVLDSESFALEPLALLEEGGFLPPACAERFRRAVLELAGLYESRSRDVPVLPIHGDCHAGNLLRGEDGWFFLDFDDLVAGPAVHDVWMLLPGRDAEGARQRQVLVEAYREFRDFDERTLSLVELLRAFRFVFYAAWIARRWEDPAFPDAFPHFGTDAYWENETRDLEDQLERIRGGEAGADAGEGAGPTTAGDGAELTNKDFFWDL